jgi:hypothetical protein
VLGDGDLSREDERRTVVPARIDYTESAVEIV